MDLPDFHNRIYSNRFRKIRKKISDITLRHPQVKTQILFHIKNRTLLLRNSEKETRNLMLRYSEIILSVIGPTDEDSKLVDVFNLKNSVRNAILHLGFPNEETIHFAEIILSPKYENTVNLKFIFFSLKCIFQHEGVPVDVYNFILYKIIHFVFGADESYEFIELVQKLNAHVIRKQYS